MEREPTYLSTEQKFSKLINARFDLWVSIVDDSEVDEKTKKEIKEKLSCFREGALTKWSNIDDAFYYTISSILTIIERDKMREGARALFENIRDDIWALFKEIKK